MSTKIHTLNSVQSATTTVDASFSGAGRTLSERNIEPHLYAILRASYAEFIYDLRTRSNGSSLNQQHNVGRGSDLLHDAFIDWLLAPPVSSGGADSSSVGRMRTPGRSTTRKEDPDAEQNCETSNSNSVGPRTGISDSSDLRHEHTLAQLPSSHEESSSIPSFSGVGRTPDGRIVHDIRTTLTRITTGLDQDRNLGIGRELPREAFIEPLSAVPGSSRGADGSSVGRMRTLGRSTTRKGDPDAEQNCEAHGPPTVASDSGNMSQRLASPQSSNGSNPRDQPEYEASPSTPNPEGNREDHTPEPEAARSAGARGPPTVASDSGNMSQHSAPLQSSNGNNPLLSILTYFREMERACDLLPEGESRVENSRETSTGLDGSKDTEPAGKLFKDLQDEWKTSGTCLLALTGANVAASLNASTLFSSIKPIVRNVMVISTLFSICSTVYSFFLMAHYPTLGASQFLAYMKRSPSARILFVLAARAPIFCMMLSAIFTMSWLMALMYMTTPVLVLVNASLILVFTGGHYVFWGILWICNRLGQSMNVRRDGSRAV
ncbi:hypothetical protein WG66_010926 [Moniliophthora roreri]|nr:hypothetical protein WG66_010926 [Moniliophthora roreri]